MQKLSGNSRHVTTLSHGFLLPCILDKRSFYSFGLSLLLYPLPVDADDLKKRCFTIAVLRDILIIKGFAFYSLVPDIM